MEELHLEHAIVVVDLEGGALTQLRLSLNIIFGFVYVVEALDLKGEVRLVSL